MTDSLSKPASAGPQWLCPPYGVPTATSEVTRVVGFYRVSDLTVVRAARPAAQAAPAA